MDRLGVKRITQLFNKIYDTGYIPSGLGKSTFTPPKKPKAVNCLDFKTISIMSHLTKALLKLSWEEIKLKQVGKLALHKADSEEE